MKKGFFRVLALAATLIGLSSFAPMATGELALGDSDDLTSLPSIWSVSGNSGTLAYTSSVSNSGGGNDGSIKFTKTSGWNHGDFYVDIETPEESEHGNGVTLIVMVPDEVTSSPYVEFTLGLNNDTEGTGVAINTISVTEDEWTTITFDTHELLDTYIGTKAGWDWNDDYELWVSCNADVMYIEYIENGPMNTLLPNVVDGVEDELPFWVDDCDDSDETWSSSPSSCGSNGAMKLDFDANGHASVTLHVAAAANIPSVWNINFKVYASGAGSYVELDNRYDEGVAYAYKTPCEFTGSLPMYLSEGSGSSSVGSWQNFSVDLAKSFRHEDWCGSGSAAYNVIADAGHAYITLYFEGSGNVYIDCVENEIDATSVSNSIGTVTISPDPVTVYCTWNPPYSFTITAPTGYSTYEFVETIGSGCYIGGNGLISITHSPASSRTATGNVTYHNPTTSGKVLVSGKTSGGVWKFGIAEWEIDAGTVTSNPTVSGPGLAYVSSSALPGYSVTMDAGSHYAYEWRITNGYGKVVGSSTSRYFVVDIDSYGGNTFQVRVKDGATNCWSSWVSKSHTVYPQF
jgi:hypothetical protein